MRISIRLLIASAMVLALPFVASALEPGWTAELPGITDSAVVAGGGIAVASGDSVTVFKDGKIQWTWKAEEQVRKVATDAEGSILAAFGRSLVKLSAEGMPLWESDTYDLAYLLGVMEDGVILVGYEYGLLAFGPNGGEYLWEHYAHEECDT